MPSWADIQYDEDLLVSLRRLCRRKGISTNGVLLLQASGPSSMRFIIDFDHSKFLSAYNGPRVRRWEYTSIDNTWDISYVDEMPPHDAQAPVVFTSTRALFDPIPLIQ